MGELPEFVKRFRFYHSDVPNTLKWVSKKKVLSKQARAVVAKRVLLHEVERDLEVTNEVTRIAARDMMQRRCTKRGMRLCVGGVTAIRIERVGGVRVNVVARRRRGMLCVKVTNVGDRSVRIGKLRAGCSEGVNVIVLATTAKLRKWLGLWCELEVKLGQERANDEGCVMFEVW